MIQLDEEIGVRVRQGRRRHFKYGGKLDAEQYGSSWFNYTTEGMRPLRFVREEVFYIESVDERGNGYDLFLKKKDSNIATQWNMRHPKDAQELMDALSVSEPQQLADKSLKIYIKNNIVVGISV